MKYHQPTSEQDYAYEVEAEDWNKPVYLYTGKPIPSTLSLVGNGVFWTLTITGLVCTINYWIN